MDKYMSIKDYAEYNNITVSAVHNRIYRGKLERVFVNVWLVDTESYKPGKSGRPKK